MNLEAVISRHCPQASLSHHKNALGKAWRTALPWTEEEGAICYALNRDYLEKGLQNPRVAAIITLPELGRHVPQSEKCLVLAPDPQALFFALHCLPLHDQYFPQPMVRPAIAQSAFIHPSAVLAEAVSIGEHAHIGPFAVIGENTIIGPGCRIGPHVVIGEDGLSPLKLGETKQHLPHWGGVSLGPNCRIGAHCAIARSAYFAEFTRLEADVHLASHCSVGHDCRVGAGSSFSAHACVGGRTNMGEQVWLGLGACVSNTLNIGDKARLVMGAVVIDNVPPGAAVSGNFAIAHHRNLRKKALES